MTDKVLVFYGLQWLQNMKTPFNRGFILKKLEGGSSYFSSEKSPLKKKKTFKNTEIQLLLIYRFIQIFVLTNDVF